MSTSARILVTSSCARVSECNCPYSAIRLEISACCICLLSARCYREGQLEECHAWRKYIGSIANNGSTCWSAPHLQYTVQNRRRRSTSPFDFLACLNDGSPLLRTGLDDADAGRDFGNLLHRPKAATTVLCMLVGAVLRHYSHASPATRKARSHRLR